MTETANAAWKLDALCQELELLALFGVDPAQEQAALKKAIAVLRAYDALAEMIFHRAGCNVFRIGQENCNCGVEAAQKAVSDALEGK